MTAAASGRVARERGGEVPAAAREAFGRGVLCYVCARGPAAPHLTPVVYAAAGGALWLTTARGSVKARAWRRDPSVAGLVLAGPLAVTFRGTVRTYDGLDPSTWLSIATAAPRLARAAARFTARNARFFAGYAVDARRVPLGWTPPGRVFVRVEPSAGVVFDAERGEIVERWGRWLERPSRGASVPTPRAADARALLARLPGDVRAAIGDGGRAVLALAPDRSDATVLPATWRRAARRVEVRVPSALGALAGGDGPTPAALTVDRASSWRAAEMTGMLLRGIVEVSPRRRGAAPAADSRDVVLRFHGERIVWWRGWVSGTVRP